MSTFATVFSVKHPVIDWRYETLVNFEKMKNYFCFMSNALIN